jgi:predicted RNA-binding Zn-ribbon protein involved in translation (DUF1610 family)
MNDHKNTYLRIECERCGAPLAKAEQRGKFICPYCRAVYYDRTYSKSDWEEFVGDPGPEKVNQPTFIKPDTSIKTKAPKAAPLLLLGIIAFLCLIGLAVIVLSGGKSTNLLVREPKINKPEMLSFLPKAEKAGVAVPFSNWELTVSPEISVSGSKIGLLITIKNWDDASQIFRYQPNDIILYDDRGNTYPLLIGKCEPDSPYLNRQMTFDPYEEVKYRSTEYWCSQASYLPEYFGVIPQNVTNLYLHLKEFGVFKNITFVIDL